MSKQTLYCIMSRCDLPLKMKRLFTYDEAYRLVCDWNATHEGKDMAFFREVSEQPEQS